MAKRGRPRKEKQQTTIVMVVGSAISAEIISQTLEQGNSQKVITPPATQIRPIELNLSRTKGSSSTTTKALQLGESSAQTVERGGISRYSSNPTGTTNETVPSGVITPPEESNDDQQPKQKRRRGYRPHQQEWKSRTQPTAAPTLVQPAEQVTKGNGKMDEKLGVEAERTTMANSFDIDFHVLPNRSTHVTEYITITPLPGGRPCGARHSGQPVTSAQRYPKAIAGNIGKAQ
ncbi:hypothetical protein RND71_003621 [Anisodus tanguticus]|uniref:Uncharacterized protein n=1 Tax=Anisodus tanguticus TaxID=243964 RepID=A0AAE1SW61_9SOLA|nr:hypothetical protein RND71_003621 [Anisodus tanguticus]